MSCKQVLVSVIIPVYNGEEFLVSAVDTVVGQKVDNLEIIVVDDGSTDNTAKIAGKFKRSIRYIHQPRRGASAARNEGIRRAKGDVLAFLDVDDLWHEDKLQWQLEYLNAHPSVEAVLGYTQFSVASPSKEGKLVFVDTWEPAMVLTLGCALFKRSVFDKAGLFDETLSSAEDVNWYFKAWERGVSMALSERVAYSYRRHPRGVSYGRDLITCGFLKEIKRSLDRRRLPLNGQVTPFAPLTKIGGA